MSKRTVSCVKLSQGTPNIFIEGKQVSPSIYVACMDGPSDTALGLVNAARIPVIQVHIIASYYEYFGAPGQKCVWKGGATFDYSLMDSLLERVTKCLPGIYILPRVHADPPPWWEKAHAGEMSLAYEGDGMGITYHFASTSSLLWREDAAMCIRNLVRHVEEQPYGKNVIGYHICGGNSHEWFFRPDYSAPFLRGFRAFLRGKYEDDLSRLKNAWGISAASFEKITAPTLPERRICDVGFFRDPGKRAAVVDYNIYWNRSIAEHILHLTHAAKAAVEKEQIIGVFFGYFPCACKHGAVETFSHLAFRQILASPDIDYIASPTDYDGRSLGGGTRRWPGGQSLFGGATLVQGLPESVRMHGKAWLEENDHRTHLTVINTYGPTLTAAETILMQRRVYAFSITHGMTHWWFDQAGHWYEDRRIIGEMASLVEIGRKAHAQDLASAAEVAFVMDEKSFYNTGNYQAIPFYTKAITAACFTLARAGTPVDYLLQSDLSRARRYKAYLFFNAFCLDDADLQILRDYVLKDNCHVLWHYAPGYVRNNRLDAGAIAELTGVKVSVTNKGVFAPAGAQLTTVKRSGWTSHLATEWPDAEMLISIFKKAGVHLYSKGTDGALHACKSFLAFHAWEDGRRNFHLRAPSPVYDCFQGRELDGASGSIAVELKNGETGLYFIGSRAAFLDETAETPIRPEVRPGTRFVAPPASELASQCEQLRRNMEKIHRVFGRIALNKRLVPEMERMDVHIKEIESLLQEGDAFTAARLIDKNTNRTSLMIGRFEILAHRVENAQPKSSWRINCGGPAFEENGMYWLEGTGQDSSYYLMNPDTRDMLVEACKASGEAICPDGEKWLFREFLCGATHIALPVLLGRYAVRFHLMEHCQNAPGRVFTIALNGAPSVHDLDLYTVCGGRFRPIIVEKECAANDWIVVECAGDADLYGIEITPLDAA